MKKIIAFSSTVLAVVMVMSVGVFAGSNSKNVPGYGTLAGSISTSSSGGYKVVTSTDITSNPDNAYLKTKVELQDMYGYTMANYSDSSNRGVTSFPHNFPVPHFDDVNAVYGAHNVQGGSTYSAQVVYTVTTSIAY